MKGDSPIRWRRRKFLAAVVATLGYRLGVAAERVPAVRIFFLGNSYTFCNELPQVVAALLISSRVLNPQIGGNLKGSYRLEQHATDPDALKLFKQGPGDGRPWDVVVVQEQSVLSAVASVDAAAKQMMQNGLTKLVAAARDSNPQVLIIDFEVWARHADQWKAGSEAALATGADVKQAYERIRLANLEAIKAAKLQAPGLQIAMSPVGDFWKLAGDTRPELVLHDSDGSHPSVLGTYLTGLVIAGTIGGRAVIEKATWIGDCPASQAKKVKRLLLDHPEIFKSADE